MFWWKQRQRSSGKKKKEWELFGWGLYLSHHSSSSWVCCLVPQHWFLPWILLAPPCLGGRGGQWGAGETLALTLQRREEDRLWVTQPIPYPHSGLHFSEYMVISIFKRIFSKKSDNLVKFGKGILFPAFSQGTVINLHFLLGYKCVSQERAVYLESKWWAWYRSIFQNGKVKAVNLELYQRWCL